MEPFERSKDHKLESDTKLRRAAEMVRRFVQRSEKYRRPHLDLAKKAREMYECWGERAKSQIGRAQLSLPYAYQIIESEIPQVAQSFLKEKPFIKYRARRQAAMIFENDLSDFSAQQLDAMSFDPKFVNFVRSMMIDGTSIAKVPYKYKEIIAKRRVPQIDPLTGVSSSIKEESLEITYDGPDFENVPIQDFFPDWSVKTPGDVEAMRGVVHRTFKTFAQLKQESKTGRYKNMNEVEQSLSCKGPDAWSKDTYYSSSYDGQQWDRLNDNEPGIKDGAKLEVWEYWGLFDPNNDGDFEEYLITIVNGDVAIRCEENFYDFKFKPFVACINVPRDGEFYGISELLAVRGLIREATSLRNARLDQTNIAINRMYVLDRNAGINPKSLVARPGGLIFTNDMQGIRELPAPEIPPSAYREIQEINSEIQTTTAISSGPSLSEAGRVFGRSATGANFVQNIATSRASLKSILLAELFFKRFARIIQMTNRQFVTDEQWIRVSDPNRENPYSVLPPEAFYCDYDFEILTNFQDSEQDTFQKLQMSMQFFQVAEQSQPGTIKWDAFFEDMGHALLGRRIKKFFRNDQERMQLQMQQLAGEQMANAQIGAAATQPGPNGMGGDGGGPLQ